jgi:hypothetical protein
MTVARCRVLFAFLISLISSSSAFSPLAFHPTLFVSLLGAAASAETASTMSQKEVQVGDTIPSVELKELVTGAAAPVPINLVEACAGKKVAIFGVPGAFTPGCSKSHLPSFMEAQDELKAKGVEATFCVATNDAYVMEVWM